MDCGIGKYDKVFINLNLYYVFVNIYLIKLDDRSIEWNNSVYGSIKDYPTNPTVYTLYLPPPLLPSSNTAQSINQPVESFPQ